MRTRRRRSVGAILAGGLTLVLLPACEPPLPRPVLTVTTVADGLDHDVGDGVCEVTPGAGDCSLRAAVAEANAAGRADVVVRAGSHELTVADPHDGHPDIDITGDVRINWERRELATIDGSTGVLDVHAGAVFAAHGLEMTSSAQGTIVRVAGTLVLGESRMFQMVDLSSGSAPALDVAEGATALLSNSSVSGAGGSAAIVNRGDLQARFSSLEGIFVPAVHTDPGAVTTVGASRLTRYTYFIRAIIEDAVGASCTGAMPTSAGHNRVQNDTCDLTGPGDVQGVDQPWVDLVPPGVLGCGEAYHFDIGGRTRPADGDFDGTSACDAGPIEQGSQILITTSSLPSATVGSCYEGWVYGNGATKPYTWSAEGLPPGLSIDGDRIVGIPEVAGDFEVTITARAVDGGGTTTTTIAVAPSADPPMVSC